MEQQVGSWWHMRLMNGIHSDLPNFIMYSARECVQSVLGKILTMCLCVKVVDLGFLSCLQRLLVPVQHQRSLPPPHQQPLQAVQAALWLQALHRLTTRLLRWCRRWCLHSSSSRSVSCRFVCSLFVNSEYCQKSYLWEWFLGPTLTYEGFRM